MQKWALSLDTDWAPQFVLDFVLDMLAQYNIPATFFCTSPYIFPKESLVEVALHPNYLPNSTHGATEEDCLKYVRNLYPQAKGHRSHCYYWHTRMSNLFSQYKIGYDASLLMLFQANLQPHLHNNIVRIPTWSGDSHLLSNVQSHEEFVVPHMNEPGLKVLNFHPIHIYLNSTIFKASHEINTKIRLVNVQQNELQNYICEGFGVRTLFKNVLSFLQTRQDVFLLKDIYKKHSLAEGILCT